MTPTGTGLAQRGDGNASWLLTWKRHSTKLEVRWSTLIVNQFERDRQELEARRKGDRLVLVQQILGKKPVWARRSYCCWSFLLIARNYHRSFGIRIGFLLWVPTNLQAARLRPRRAVSGLVTKVRGSRQAVD